MEIWSSSPVLIGQGTAGVEAGPTRASVLAILRWFQSLSLSAADPESRVVVALVPWALAIVVMVAIGLLVQGPSRFLGQLFDVSGHLSLLNQALSRVRRGWRLALILTGVLVFSWVGYQTLAFQFDGPTNQAEFEALRRSESLGRVAMDYAAHALLLPHRDVAALGNYVVLLIMAVMMVFGMTSNRWDEVTGSVLVLDDKSDRWATVAWIATGLYVFYRVVMLGSWLAGTGLAGFPQADDSGAWVVWSQLVLIPPLMLISDGLLLAWVTVGLRQADPRSQAELPMLQIGPILSILPMMILVCALVMPGRYTSHILLLLGNVADLEWLLGASPALGLVRIILILQALGLVLLGLLGAAAWSGRSLRGTFGLFGRLWRNAAARLLVVVVSASLGAGALTLLSYLALLNVGGPEWALNAAASYAHYGTLGVGLMLVAALIDLAGQYVTEESAKATMTVPHVPLEPQSAVSKGPEIRMPPA